MGNILITGAGGFIGSNLLLYVHKMHPDCLDKIVFLSDSIIQHNKIIRSDNYQFTAKKFAEQGIDTIETVVHLGAYIPKDQKSANLFDENYNNISNTAYLLKNLPSKPHKFIYISTVDVYSRVNEIVSENTQTSPVTFYGACKLFCEQMVITYCKANKIIPQVLRLGNIYGSGETAFKKLIPETIRRILRKKPPIIHGTGEEKRSFLNVKDCVSAIWKSIELDEFIGPVNIVSSPSVKVREIIHHLIRISGLSSEIRIVNNNSDLYDIIYNNNKMLKHLVSETVSLEDGLTEEFNFEKTKLQTSLL